MLPLATSSPSFLRQGCQWPDRGRTRWGRCLTSMSALGLQTTGSFGLYPCACHLSIFFVTSDFFCHPSVFKVWLISMCNDIFFIFLASNVWLKVVYFHWVSDLLWMFGCLSQICIIMIYTSVCYCTKFIFLTNVSVFCDYELSVWFLLQHCVHCQLAGLVQDITHLAWPVLLTGYPKAEWVQSDLAEISINYSFNLPVWGVGHWISLVFDWVVKW